MRFNEKEQMVILKRIYEGYKALRTLFGQIREKKERLRISSRRKGDQEYYTLSCG
jgi:hypothetical protein